MTDEAGSSSEWSREQDKAFENALATYPEDSADRWEKIAADVPGKTLEEIKEHYELLEEDVNRIKPLPEYSSPESSADQAGDEGASKKGSSHYNSESNHGSKSSKSDQELRKGIAWTEDEHRLFLLGLDKYGKGDWRSISRNFVVTRTPTQVASHAQKYFIRLNSMNKIGDDLASMILSVLAMQTCQHPKVRSLAKKRCCSWSYRRKINQTDSRTSCWTTWFWCARCSNYRQPVGGPLVSAVGTPVNLPAQAHMAYGVSATLPGAVVPGAPVTYPMPRTSAQ